MLILDNLKSTLKSKENEHKEDIKFFEDLVSFEKLTMNSNISVEAMNEIYTQFQKELASIQSKTDELVKNLTFRDSIAEEIGKIFTYYFTLGIVDVKQIHTDKVKDYTLPKRYMKMLKSVGATKYLKGDIVMHTPKKDIYELKDALREQMNDIILSDRKKKEFSSSKDLNKFQRAIHQARNVLAVYKWISKDIERIYNQNKNNPKIFPPTKRGGSKSDFGTGRREHNLTLNKPAYHQGTFHY